MKLIRNCEAFEAEIVSRRTLDCFIFCLTLFLLREEKFDDWAG